MLPAPAIVVGALELILVWIKRLYAFLAVQVFPHRVSGLAVHDLHHGRYDLGLLPEHILPHPFFVQLGVHGFDDIVHPVEGVEIGGFHVLKIEFLIALELPLQNLRLPLGARPGNELPAVHAEQLIQASAYLVQLATQVHIVQDVQHSGRVRRKAYLQHVFQAGGLGIVHKGRAAQETQHETRHRQVRPGLFEDSLVHLVIAYGIFDFIQIQPGHLIFIEAVEVVHQNILIGFQEQSIVRVNLHCGFCPAFTETQQLVHACQYAAGFVCASFRHQSGILVFRLEINGKQNHSAVLILIPLV